jgi:hypothetical protein
MEASGVMAIPIGKFPTGIGVPGVFVAKFIGVTESSRLIVTYAMDPSGVIAMPQGPLPTGIGVPGVFVAKFIGVMLSLL